MEIFKRLTIIIFIFLLLTTIFFVVMLFYGKLYITEKYGEFYVELEKEGTIFAMLDSSLPGGIQEKPFYLLRAKVFYGIQEKLKITFSRLCFLYQFKRYGNLYDGKTETIYFVYVYNVDSQEVVLWSPFKKGFLWIKK